VGNALGSAWTRASSIGCPLLPYRELQLREAVVTPSAVVTDQSAAGKRPDASNPALVREAE
jgi:hypothetical protein